MAMLERPEVRAVNIEHIAILEANARVDAFDAPTVPDNRYAQPLIKDH